MADDKRFSHITVNAGEDDDVVIQAGAYATTPQVQAEAVEEMPADQAQWEAEALAGESEPAYEPEPEPAHAPAHAAPQHAAANAPAHAAPQHAARPADDYNEQTLEDLDAGPMSGMQKAVLAGVTIIIVAAIVYFTCFMH